MTRQAINHGSTVGDGLGESLFLAFQKVNANESELYASDIRLLRANKLVMELGLSLCDQGRSPSYLENAVGSETLVRVWTAVNPFNYAKRWSRGGIRINRSGGKSGETLAGALARLTDITAQAEKPQYCIIWLGGNDVNGVANEAASATAIVQMKSDTIAIVNGLLAAGIIPIMLTMPDNATWQLNDYRMRTHYRYINWLREYCHTSAIRLVEMNNVLSRSLRQIATAATLSRTGTTATVTQTAHGYAVGDYVQLTLSSDITGDQLAFAAILTVPDANTFTFTHTNSGTLTAVTTMVTRAMVYPDLVSDGKTHLSERGARRIAEVFWAGVQDLLPPCDVLSSTNNDYYNLVGCGTAYAIPQISNNAFEGTTGTIDGTTATVTGTMPAGWNLNAIAGSPTISIALVPRTDAPYTNRKWLQLTVTAGTSDAQFQIRNNHTKPNPWVGGVPAVANTTIVRPTTPNGLFAVCVTNGNTHATVQPSWPTEIGKQVTDNTCVWEMRAGWRDGDVCWAGIEYLINSVSDRTAIEAMAFGLFDETTGANTISDHAFSNVNSNPEYENGETGYMVTPEASLLHDASGAINFSTKIRVRAGMSATISLDRPTWRKIGLAG